VNLKRELAVARESRREAQQFARQFEEFGDRLQSATSILPPALLIDQARIIRESAATAQLWSFSMSAFHKRQAERLDGAIAQMESTLNAER